MDPKLIDMLNKALALEYQAAYQYLHHYNNVRSKHTDVISHFQEHMQDEQNHANQLAARIYLLGGTPTINFEQFAEFTEDIDEALRQDIVGEQIAINHYKEISLYCQEIGDIATQMLVEDIILNEVHHIDEFAKIRRSTVTSG